MMKAMHRHGCADFTLTQQVEQLLCDDALQEYSITFIPDRKSQDRSNEFIQESVLNFQYYPKNITQEIISAPSGKLNQNADVNQPVSPLEERVGVQAAQPPVAAGLNEVSDTTQVRKNKHVCSSLHGFNWWNK